MNRKVIFPPADYWNQRKESQAMTTNQTILRMYINQIDVNGTYYSASAAEVMQTTMDFAAEKKLDIDDAARALELSAQRLDVTINELVAAVTTLCVFTGCTLDEARWQLVRVVNVVRQVEQEAE